MLINASLKEFTLKAYLDPGILVSTFNQQQQSKNNVYSFFNLTV